MAHWPYMIGPGGEQRRISDTMQCHSSFNHAGVMLQCFFHTGAMLSIRHITAYIVCISEIMSTHSFRSQPIIYLDLATYRSTYINRIEYIIGQL